jgi:hypothetical protein
MFVIFLSSCRRNPVYDLQTKHNYFFPSLSTLTFGLKFETVNEIALLNKLYVRNRCEGFSEQQVAEPQYGYVSTVRNCAERSLGHFKAGVDNNWFREKSKQAGRDQSVLSSTYREHSDELQAGRAMLHTKCRCFATILLCWKCSNFWGSLPIYSTSWATGTYDLMFSCHIWFYCKTT